MEKRYEGLLVWQRGIQLAELVYELTTRFPKAERLGLTHQMRRAAVSIPRNIAEGSTRGPKDFLRYLRIARGSLAELDTQLRLASALGFLDDEDRLREMLENTSRLLHGLYRHIRAK